MNTRPILVLLLTLCCVGNAAVAQETKLATQRTAPKWKNGPPADESYFPIAVWLQDPKNAARYKAAGINLYVGLWRGPTTNQLAVLQQAGMSVIFRQNRAGLENKDHPSIVGWMHDDEPDNAQSLGQGKGYGPPILPEKIARDYERMRAADPTRPVLLNLGQGVAWDNYIGRGVRRNHPEDYAEYVKGCDIASFDIYPAVHDKPEVAGKLEFVAHGVERLVQWARGEKTVWNCIECTHISNPQIKATPLQVRAEVWMALIHGSRGLIYFVHQFKPTFKEAALLDDREMLAAVTAINRQIHELAPVLNSSSIVDGVSVRTEAPSTAFRTPSPPRETPSPLNRERAGVRGESGQPQSSSTNDPPISWMLKRRGDTAYLFAVNMRNLSMRGAFIIRESALALGQSLSATVLDESRSIPMRNGELTDEFKPYEVHLYELRRAK